MSRSRYEPIPQIEEVIDLHSYNYNTGVPTSASNSPPPSFHSRLSPEPPISRDQTPRPDDSITNIGRPSGPEPWNGSNIDIDAITISREELILSLRRRVEKLEETVGRLLPEKEGRGCKSEDRSNCCVIFGDMESRTTEEREVILRNSNCCVTFGSRYRHAHERKQYCAMLCVMSIVALFTIWILLVVTWRPRADCLKELCGEGH